MYLGLILSFKTLCLHIDFYVVYQHIVVFMDCNKNN
jgi:hypothetical protein